MNVQSKVGLGTVQFGLKYGISNHAHKPPSDQEIKNILEYAQNSGIRLLDTAALYGQSEVKLGQFITNHDNFSIITKTVSLEDTDEAQRTKDTLVQTLERSRNNLSMPENMPLNGLLIHDANNLRNSNAHVILDELRELKDKNKIKKIGVSIYTAEDIDHVLSLFTPDIIQLPFSVADQRLLKSGYLEILKEKQIEVHARSLFLQGLLIMPLENIPAKFSPIHSYLNKWHQWCQEIGYSPLQLALDFGLKTDLIDKIILGVHSLNQLQDIVENAGCTFQHDVNYDHLSMKDDFFLNPANWAQL